MIGNTNSYSNNFCRYSLTSIASLKHKILYNIHTTSLLPMMAKIQLKLEQDGHEQHDDQCQECQQCHDQHGD